MSNSKPIRRRTDGERRAYLQGYLAALCMAQWMTEVSPKGKAQLLSVIEFHQKQLESEAA